MSNQQSFLAIYSAIDTNFQNLCVFRPSTPTSAVLFPSLFSFVISLVFPEILSVKYVDSYSNYHSSRLFIWEFLFDFDSTPNLELLCLYISAINICMRLPLFDSWNFLVSIEIGFSSKDLGSRNNWFWSCIMGWIFGKTSVIP